MPNTNDERRPRIVSDTIGLTISNASSLPNRALPNAPSETWTRSVMSNTAAARTAVPRIVSPSLKALRNSVLSPYIRRHPEM